MFFMLIFKKMKRKINARHKQRVAAKNNKDQKFWSQPCGDSEGSVRIRSSELVHSEFLQEMLEDRQKFWIAFRPWATSQKLCITLKQWVNVSSSACYQHVKIRNSECLKTTNGNIRSSVYLTCKENSEVLCCVRTRSESSEVLNGAERVSEH